MDLLTDIAACIVILIVGSLVYICIYGNKGRKQ